MDDLRALDVFLLSPSRFIGLFFAIIILCYSASLWTEFTPDFLLYVNEKNLLYLNAKDLASLRGKNLASLREMKKKILFLYAKKKSCFLA